MRVLSDGKDFPLEIWTMPCVPTLPIIRIGSSYKYVFVNPIIVDAPMMGVSHPPLATFIFIGGRFPLSMVAISSKWTVWVAFASNS